jgi:hypothetical protein
MRVLVRLAIVGLVGCAPSYQPATLSTLAPKTRVILADSSKVDLQQPLLRGDTLFSQNARAIPVDSISRVEAEHGTSTAEVMGIVAGAAIGLLIANEINKDSE